MTTIGIDLGTTNSCVGVWQNGRVEIIANDMGNRTTPSYVSFNDEHRLIGNAAKSSSSKNPTNTVFDAKRLIGCKFADTQVQNDIKHFPFKVVNRNNQPVIQVDYMDELKEFRPEEISSMILHYLKTTAEKYLGEPITEAVITVPAYFSDSQRQATKDAGKLAGLNVRRVLNEPTAAAIAYGLEKNDGIKRHILVFDMGGGTFDVSLLSVCDGFFKVLSTAGDTHLGGEDFDSLVVDDVVKDFCRRHRNLDGDPRKNKRAMRRLRTEVETAKKSLSTTTYAQVEVDGFYDGIDLSYRLTRARFNKLCDSLFQKSLEPVRRVLSDANMEYTKVDEVVLVGGSTRIPKIREMVSEMFGGKELNMSINPDEAVAYGAAVNAAVLSGKHDDDEKLGDLLLVDVAPLSLGLETEGGLMDPLIPRQTTIPYTINKVYSTAKNNQTNVRIQVYEGERAMTRHNNKLGEFTLYGLPPRRRGQPQIEVCFSLNTDGILNVSAKDKTSGKENKIEITNERGRMTDDEIKEKIKEAEKYAQQDQENLAKIHQRNEFENYLYEILNDDDNQTQLSILAEEGLDWLNDNPDADTTELQIYRDTLEPRIQQFREATSATSATADADADADADAVSVSSNEVDVETE